MDEDSDGYSKCGRKAALSVFFFVELIAFASCLISLLSPSWQWVALENGRTEHHHGLWLDCKRDYSYDYGRTREYYESLYRRDFQGSPFYWLILPPFECVYKFDYYIDPEDLYDHDHDDNKLWDDAYQHLFLAHKIAALAACGAGVILAGVALLLGVYAYCHRTFITAMTSLVALASVLAFAGVGVFYGWAITQNNQLIRQRDEQETYEQILGWAFYLHLVGGILHFVASMLGCFAASIAFGKRRAKLVRIDVVESHPSSQADLLSATHLGTSINNSAPFKRSFSAVYKVDSSALQQWDKQCSKQVKRDQESFVRTKSMPMLGKKQSKRNKKASFSMDHRSSSNLFLTGDTEEMTTDTTNTIESTASERRRRPPKIPTPQPPKLKSALKTPQSDRRGYGVSNFRDSGTTDQSGGLDTTYEYLPCDHPPSSMGVSSFMGGRCSSRGTVYDSVCENEPPDLYLEPNSKAEARVSTSTINNERRALAPSLLPVSGSAHSIPAMNQQRITVIDDVARPSSSIERRPETTFGGSSETAHIQSETRTRIRELQTIEELQRIERQRRIRPPAKPILPDKPVGIGLVPPSKTTTSTETTFPPLKPPPTPDPLKKPVLGAKDFGITPTTSNGYCTRVSGDTESSPPRELCLNTFGIPDIRGSTRSLTSLKFRPGFNDSNAAAAIFERPDSSVDTPLPSTSSKESTLPVKTFQQPQSLHKRLLISTIPDEVDRSVGSSTMMENDTRDSTSSPMSYARDAELRLNLFLADSLISSSPRPPPSTSSHSNSSRRPATDDSSETTV